MRPCRSDGEGGDLETLDLGGAPPSAVPVAGGEQSTIGNVEPASLEEMEASEDEAKIMARIEKACDRLEQRIDDCIQRAAA
jgi:hypothetical protein